MKKERQESESKVSLFLVAVVVVFMVEAVVFVVWVWDCWIRARSGAGERCGVPTRKGEAFAVSQNQMQGRCKIT